MKRKQIHDTTQRHLRQSEPDALGERAIRLGEYIIAHEATVRSAAKAFGISKSTVHKDISAKLPLLHYGLYEQVKVIMEKNKQERHIRGGMATKRKYENQKLRCTDPQDRSLH